MCGGEGTRLATDREKPLFEVGGRPMIDGVVAALEASRIDATTAVASPATPRTREHLALPTIDAPGGGYVADLRYALERVDRPVFTVVADLPLLEAAVVDEVLDRYEAAGAEGSLSVCVPASLKRALGASVDATLAGEHRELAPTGVNVVGGGEAETTTISWDARLAVNVNRPSDADLAEALR